MSDWKNLPEKDKYNLFSTFVENSVVMIPHYFEEEFKKILDEFEIKYTIRYSSFEEPIFEEI